MKNATPYPGGKFATRAQAVHKPITRLRVKPKAGRLGPWSSRFPGHTQSKPIQKKKKKSIEIVAVSNVLAQVAVGADGPQPLML